MANTSQSSTTNQRSTTRYCQFCGNLATWYIKANYGKDNDGYVFFCVHHMTKHRIRTSGEGIIFHIFRQGMELPGE